MNEMPNLNDALAELRQKTAAWQTNADNTRLAGNELTWAHSIDRMSDRDKLAAEIVAGFQKLDEAMSAYRGIGIAATAAWSSKKLADEDLAQAKEQWPELTIFEDEVIRNFAALIGLQAVRHLAQVAARNARKYLAAHDEA
ncbi:hypothetical protein ABZ599_16220 [Streptomyces misionensis]|uniref:hypothetical protein n=1 Tax=Streptomyces misionensis TaxID=67331 RepID=UPI003401AFC6